MLIAMLGDESAVVGRWIANAGAWVARIGAESPTPGHRVAGRVLKVSGAVASVAMADARIAVIVHQVPTVVIFGGAGGQSVAVADPDGADDDRLVAIAVLGEEIGESKVEHADDWVAGIGDGVRVTDAKVEIVEPKVAGRVAGFRTPVLGLSVATARF